MSTFSSGEPEQSNRKKNLPRAPASGEQRCHDSSAESRPMSGSPPWKPLPTHLELRSQHCSFQQALNTWEKPNSTGAKAPTTTSSSKRGASSPPSTKQPVKSIATATPAVHVYRVDFHREVAKLVAFHGLESDDFRPTIAALITALRTDPKQFPKKKGKLKERRAASIKFADGVAWRAVFSVDDATGIVRVLALGPHDEAYAKAERRS